MRCSPRTTSCSIPDVVTHTDQQGSTPLSELVVQYTLESKHGGGRSNPQRNAIPLEQIVDIPQECQRSTLFRDFWSKVELLVLGEVTTTNATTQNDGNHSILHGAAAMAQTCPAILTDLLLRCYGDQISQPNSHGWWPLHLCICSYKNNNTIKNKKKQQHSHRILRQQQLYFFDCLLRLYPRAATLSVPPLRVTDVSSSTTTTTTSPYTFRPTHPSSTLCLAIRHAQGDWNDHQNYLNHARARHYHNSNNNNNLPRHHNNHPENEGGMLARLWRVAPQCIAYRDARTGLYPFQLAAVCRRNVGNNNGSSDVDRSETEERVWQLDTIFNLLRAQPLAVLLLPRVPPPERPFHHGTI